MIPAAHPGAAGTNLTGRVAIVTGGGSAEGGIGRSIALTLASAGAAIAVVDLDISRAEEVRAVIEAAGGRAVAMAGDVADAERCAAMVGEVTVALGRLDILVNNVGLSATATSLTNLDVAALSRVFAINFQSAVAMTAAALPHFTAAGKGAIVNIASIAGMQAYGNIAYGPSKAALITFTRETAVMHGRDGVRANVIAPGHIQTPHIAGMMDADMRRARKNIGPLGVEGDAWDIAQAVLFLASDAARFVTGVLLPVDGGVSMVGPMTAHGLIERGNPA